MRTLLSTPADSLRRRAVRQAEELFSHADDPLADTLRYAGDPGLFGPESITWELMGDTSTFIKNGSSRRRPSRRSSARRVLDLAEAAPALLVVGIA